MSYLARIAECNTVTGQYQPFIVANEQMGWVTPEFADHLLKWTDVFLYKKGTIHLHDALKTPQMRTEACRPVLKALHQQGVIGSWVGEEYAVNHAYGEEPRLLIERAAVSYFGVRGYGVHVNGLVKKSDGIYIWIAVRTKAKPFWPGMLDQMIAGGQPEGIGLLENVIKESAEEANIPESMAKTAELVSEINYRGESHRGMQVDTLFNYDLWLPEDFMPENTDGEVEEFILMPLQEMADITENTAKFKPNCNLVNMDLLIRFGLIDESHPDYQAIHKQLYVSAH